MNQVKTGAKSFIQSSRFWGLVFVILSAAAMRMIPHPPNFTPIAAMAIFGGAMFERRALAFAVPLSAMLLSDLFLGFHFQMFAVYASFVAITCLGFWLQRDRSVSRIGATSILGSLLFFFVTNFAVWAQTEMYPKTVEGLLSCFVAAIPFLGNALAGDLFFTSLLFGAWALAERLVPQWRNNPAWV